mmetsp:Transcript_30972/g.79605  ORF Transcript_30972/g.79605 Transcript_30972/m.79605 type:complete len:173 (+) Transcript_30972:70-588(+)
MASPDEDALMDAATSRLLMKKTWCHGQIVAAFQGLAYGYWGANAPAGSLSEEKRALLVSAALLLPLWTCVSWWSMQGRTRCHGRVILGFGSALLVLYATILSFACTAIMADDADSGFSSAGPLVDGYTILIAAIICTGLQLIETFAYLLVVCCLRDALVDDVSDRQYGLLTG